MVGMGVPMGMVNQAAFSSQGVLGMQGIMGAVPQQSLPQQQPNFQQQNSLQQGTNMQQNSGAKNQRTFVGVVTKMLDTYGFVDDDVFFQHSVIRGSHPRVGDKVMVEANYNPSMPFKWNAYRIQLLNAATQQEPARQAPQQQQMHQPQRGGQESQRWGAAPASGTSDRADRNGGARGNDSPLHRSSAARRHSPPPRRASPPRRTSSPKRDARPAREIRDSREPREVRRSPPPRRAASPRKASSPSAPAKNDRKRERSPSGSVAPSVRRESASPPRRRARIIPRYECRAQKPALLSPIVSGSVLRHRYSKLYLPSDYVDLSFDWVRSFQLDLSLDLSNPIQFHVFNKDVDFIGEEEIQDLDPEDADHRHQVKVLLLSHAGKSEVVKKAFCLMADGTTDDHQEPQSLLKNLHFLVGARGKETMGIGGSWSPSQDGADPNSATTMIRTAVRTTKSLTGIDLSSVSQWFSMVQIRYYRADKQRIDHVNYLLPDTQSLALDDAQWMLAETKIAEQLKAKLANVDALKIEEDEPPVVMMVEESESVVAAAAAAADVVPEQSIPDVKKEEELQAEEPKVLDNVKAEESDVVADVSMNSTTDADNSEAPAAENGQGPTNWSNLDPKSMKVAELRVELELRGLETKGIKTLLVQRLQTALDTEKAAEASVAARDVEMRDAAENAVKQEGGEENPAAFIAPSIEETKAKTEAEAKKEAEEAEKRKKKEEQLEKEKKEKREALEKHYQLPKDKKILVFPSKSFKSGKFDCKVLSLSSLLDYRHDDNKENQFEVSLFAEAFKEMIERNAAFTIYETLANCGDRDAEKKRRDEAREKPVEPKEPKEPAETTEKAAEGEEKKDEKEEKRDEKKDEKREEKREKVERIDLKSVVANRTVYEAFSLFDSNLCGYLTEKDIEEILYNGEFGISRGQIQKLAKKLSVRDKINYRHLTDVLTDMDGNVRHTPGGADDVVETDDLIRGFGYNLAKSMEPADSGAAVKSSEVSASSDGVVIINGSAVNVVQKMKLLKQVEKERDEAKSTVSEQLSLIEQLREAKAEIDKKKKDIDSHYHKSNKKLNETSAQLKSTQDENSALKQALQDCKRHADRIFSVVEKVMPPPPKKEEKSKKDEKEKTDKKDDKVSEKSAEKSTEEPSQEVPASAEQAAEPSTEAEPIVIDESEDKDAEVVEESKE